MKPLFFTLLSLTLLIGAGCQPAFTPADPNTQAHLGSVDEANLLAEGRAVATFAGGCFWCMESRFEKVPGVTEVISGFSGGSIENPSYDDVARGRTDHVEAVQVYYDPRVVSYPELLDVFWRRIDPTDKGGQFADRGSLYQPGIYYTTDYEREEAEASKARLAEYGPFDEPIITEIWEFENFYEAPEYHQDYYKKNSAHYLSYEEGSGRAPFIRTHWPMQTYQKPSVDELKESLTPLQYDVTQNNATERPFDNEYNENKADGIYVDIVTGEPLFSSSDKFDSKSGWPSFTRPIEGTELKKTTDYDIGYPRTEVKSHSGNTHLGHVFPDGPKDETGLRYCINSASLQFVPKEELEAEGYGEYLYLFE